MKMLYLIFILTTILSCNKDQIQYTVKGIVKNKVTNSSVNQAKLSFYQTEINGNALNPNFVYIGSASTNSSGEYSISFDRKNIDKFKIRIEQSEFYENETVYSSAVLSSENDNTFNYELESKSWIEVRLKNNFVQNNEQLNFHKYNVKEGCEDCCTSGNLAVPYTIPDTTFVCAVVGDVYFKYTYGETTANTSITDSVLCTQFDTTSIFIQY
jgi:hypothetical protein